MATLTHCDGCGFTEPEHLADTKKKIRRVTLSVELDARTSFPESREKHESDLCPNCQGTLLHTYFNIPAEGKLALPAFIGPKKPKELEEIVGPESLKA